jgi:hypothetical protein
MCVLGLSVCEHDMAVRPAESEGAHPRQAPAVPLGPRLAGRRDLQAEGLERDMWIRALEMETRRDGPVLQREGRLDEPGDLRRGLEVTNVRLHRPDEERHRTRPGRGDEQDELANQRALVKRRVEHERRHGLGEQTESSFGMRLVLRALRCCADAQRSLEYRVDLGRVIGRAVIEQERKRRRPCGGDAVAERFDNSRAVFAIVHRQTDECT